MVKPPMIADDYASINRRLREIQQGDFILPNGIAIMLSSQVRPPIHLPDLIDTVFILHAAPTSDPPRLVLVHSRQPDMITERWRTLTVFLRRFFESARPGTSQGEILLSSDDCVTLIQRLGRR